MKSRRKLIKKLADLLKVNVSPVKQIHRLKDREDTVYLWDLNCSDQQAEALKSKVKSEFIQRNNRSPRAIHIITNNLDSFEEMSPDRIRELFDPWLDQTSEE